MTFQDLNINASIKRALDEAGITTPTQIQDESIPLLLNSSKIDFHGQAQTGTGKTLAFGIPLLEKIDTNSKKTQALILAPTRELALQITDSLEAASKYLNISIATIYGGVPINTQISKLRSGAQIVVGTPGRVNDHLRQKTLILDNIYTLVLDEADVMLDMGFREEIDDILNKLNKERQIWLFSATVKAGINALMKSHMTDTKSVRVSKEQVGNVNTEQYYCLVPFKSRLQVLARFIETITDFYGFIFCQTKILTSEIAEQLIKRGYSVGALHGDMSQAQRSLTVKKFKNKELTILVATDVAARGIDVANLTHVINYSVPEDLESYVHRVGRTGRAGKKGTSITFASKSELRDVGQIEKRFGIKIDPIEVPSLDSLNEIRTKLAQEFVQDILGDEKSSKPNSLISNVVKELTFEQVAFIASKLLQDKFIGTLDNQEINLSSGDSRSDDFGGSRGRSSRGGPRRSGGSRGGFGFSRGGSRERSGSSDRFSRPKRTESGSSEESSSGFSRPRREDSTGSGFGRSRSDSGFSRPRREDSSSGFSRPRREDSTGGGFSRPRTESSGDFSRPRSDSSSGFSRPRREDSTGGGFGRRSDRSSDRSSERSSGRKFYKD